jgi:acetyl-CoA C-acetyltransferase
MRLQLGHEVRGMNPCYISGAAVTKHVAYHIDWTWKEMVSSAILEAIEDAGLQPRDVDAGVVAYLGDMTIETGNIGPLIADSTGMEPAGITGISGACAGGAMALYHAFALVRSGMADVAVAAGFEKGGDLYEYVETICPSSDSEYDYTFGLTHLDWLALITHGYVDAYGVDGEAITTWVEDRHRLARLHPRSFYYGQSMPSRSDLRRNLMYLASARSDGAAAVVVTKADLAKPRNRALIEIAGMGYSSGSAYLPHRYVHGGDRLRGCDLTKKAAARAYEMAGFKNPKDADFLQVSDGAPGVAFMELEALGIYEPGEAWRGVLQNEHGLLGKYPTNTHGGSIAFGHASGAAALVNVVEATDQFLERAGDRQIADRPLNNCICQASGGSQSNNVVAVLKKGGAA